MRRSKTHQKRSQGVPKEEVKISLRQLKMPRGLLGCMTESIYAGNRAVTFVEFETSIDVRPKQQVQPSCTA
jgi:hypothetical protein